MMTTTTGRGRRGLGEELGSREAAKERAKGRAREEGRPIYVLRYCDGDRLYTASMHPALSLHRTERHGHYQPRGDWVPGIVLDIDDALAYLRSFERQDYDDAARDLERVRGDKGE